MRFNREAIDDLYARWQRGGGESVHSIDVDRAAPLLCVLQVHTLEHRYDLIADIVKGGAARSRVT